MMKNILHILCFLLLCFSCFAQSPRMALVEEGTQASCPPCFTANPIIFDLVEANKDKVILISFQTSWPGVDAMNADNPEEVADRIPNYYGITGVPGAALNGSTSSQPITSHITQSSIDNVNSQMSEFDMTLECSIENGHLKVKGMAVATSEVVGDFKLHIAILEGLIVNADLPYLGTNGETEFHHVFKKFIYGSDGLSIEPSWEVGDSYEFDASYDLSTLNIYNYSEVEVVAFIQNDENKFVHQAVLDDELQAIVDFDSNASVNKVGGYEANVCRGTQEISPTFKIQNNGSNPLTSATINYNVNGEMESTYDWTGSLETYENETVELPSLTYDALESNVINISVSNPNGNIDENNADNSASSEEFSSYIASDEVYVEIFTDNYGDETYWEIRNSSGEVMGFGGNPNVGTDNIDTGTYPAPSHPDMYQNATLYNHTVLLNSNDCYTYHMTDYYGDGISLGAGPYWKVTNAEGEILNEGTTESFGELIAKFEGEGMVSSVNEIVELNSINVFPNPITDMVNVEFNLINDANSSITISNSMGQQIQIIDLGGLSRGTHLAKINAFDLVDGFYQVQIRLNENIITKKINVLRK